MLTVLGSDRTFSYSTIEIQPQNYDVNQNLTTYKKQS